ncbi:MAG: polymerase sigma-70 factor, subfamily [Gaiellaceae bacterium]|nr:polymerase sigma-70 factor, subfamily [Gaiellaceae bacterium]
MQTTFLNAFRAFRRGVRPELEAAWLYAIAANVCRSRRRSFFRRRRVECDDDLHALEDVLAAPQPLEAEALIGLGDALAAMPENQRHAILLREWQGLSYAEIAAELGITHAAVETLIFRARRTLAKGLDAEQSKPRRLVGGLNLGSLATALKGLLGGAGAAKLVAAGAVVVVAGAAIPIVHHAIPTPASRKHQQAPVRPASVVPAAAPRVGAVPADAGSAAQANVSASSVHRAPVKHGKPLQARSSAAVQHARSKQQKNAPPAASAARDKPRGPAASRGSGTDAKAQRRVAKVKPVRAGQEKKNAPAQDPIASTGTKSPVKDQAPASADAVDQSPPNGASQAATQGQSADHAQYAGHSNAGK